MLNTSFGYIGGCSTIVCVRMLYMNKYEHVSLLTENNV